MVVQWFIGKRLYIFEYICGNVHMSFAWFSYRQEWRGTVSFQPSRKYVTDDYGNLVEIVKRVTLH